MAQQVPPRCVSADHVQFAGWSRGELTISLTATARLMCSVPLTHKRDSKCYSVCVNQHLKGPHVSFLHHLQD